MKDQEPAQEQQELIAIVESTKKDEVSTDLEEQLRAQETTGHLVFESKVQANSQ